MLRTGGSLRSVDSRHKAEMIRHIGLIGDCSTGARVSRWSPRPACLTAFSTWGRRRQERSTWLCWEVSFLEMAFGVHRSNGCIRTSVTAEQLECKSLKQLSRKNGNNNFSFLKFYVMSILHVANMYVYGVCLLGGLESRGKGQRRGCTTV